MYSKVFFFCQITFPVLYNALSASYTVVVKSDVQPEVCFFKSIIKDALKCCMYVAQL